MKRIRTLLFFAFLTIVALAEVVATDFEELETEAASAYAKFIKVTSEQKVKTIAVYKGLPHKKWEAEKYEKEMKREDLLVIDGYTFYRESHKYSGSSSKPIVDVLLDPESYTKTEVMKLCGGFHPDYDIMVTSTSGVYHFQISFECSSVRFITSDTDLFVDLKRKNLEFLHLVILEAQLPTLD